MRRGRFDLDPARDERVPQIPSPDLGAQREAIEERTFVCDRAARERGETLRERVRARDARSRGGAEALRAEEREIHGCRDRRERLVRADVAGRLLAADVLLARLERVHEPAGAVRVQGLPRDAAGHLAHQRLAAGEDPEVRAAVRHRDAERLALADGDVDPQRTRWLEQRVRVRLGDLHAERARVVRGVHDLAHVDERSKCIGVLDDEAGRALGGRRELRRRHLDDLELGPARVGAQRAAIREVDLGRHDHSLASGDPNGHEGGFGRGRTAVVHGGVHDLHREQLGHERLVLERRLERALAHLGLVRRVRREELAAEREHRHRRGDVAALDRPADEERPRPGGRVQLRDPLEVRLHLQLREARADAELRMARVLRDRAEELVDVAHADAVQHRGAVGLGVRRVGVVPHLVSLNLPAAPGRHAQGWRCSLVAARSLRSLTGAPPPDRILAHVQSPPAPAVSPMCAR